MPDLNVGNQIPNFENLPESGTVNFENKPLSSGLPFTADVLDVCSQKEEFENILTREAPQIAPPDERAISGFHVDVNEQEKNPWFNPTFLAALNEVMISILNLQQKIHVDEAFNELRIRDALFEEAKTNAKVAKELMENQAQEQLVQAVASFATAGVSAAQFMQTSRNMGFAKQKVQDEIKAQEAAVLNQYDVDVQANLEVGPRDVKALPAPGKESPMLTAKREKLKEMSDPRVQEQRVQQEMREQEYRTQYWGETLKQINNGVSNVLTSTIKTDSAVLEERQKIEEGAIQALNKYIETRARARDEAAADFNKEIDEWRRLTHSFKSPFTGQA
jgi:hypothetical protein